MIRFLIQTKLGGPYHSAYPRLLGLNWVDFGLAYRSIWLDDPLGSGSRYVVSRFSHAIWYTLLLGRYIEQGNFVLGLANDQWYFMCMFFKKMVNIERVIQFLIYCWGRYFWIYQTIEILGRSVRRGTSYVLDYGWAQGE